MTAPEPGTQDRPRIRVHVDGSLAVETSPGYWVILTSAEDPDALPNAGTQEVFGDGWSEAAVVELPEPTYETPELVEWPGAELIIHGPGDTTIAPALPEDQNGWDGAPQWVREVIAPSLIAAALRAEHRGGDPR